MSAHRWVDLRLADELDWSAGGDEGDELPDVIVEQCSRCSCVRITSPFRRQKFGEQGLISNLEPVCKPVPSVVRGAA